MMHHSWKKCRRYRKYSAVSKSACMLAQDISTQAFSGETKGNAAESAQAACVLAEGSIDPQDPLNMCHNTASDVLSSM